MGTRGARPSDPGKSRNVVTCLRQKHYGKESRSAKPRESSRNKSRNIFIADRNKPGHKLYCFSTEMQRFACSTYYRWTKHVRCPLLFELFLKFFAACFIIHAFTDLGATNLVAFAEQV